MRQVDSRLKMMDINTNLISRIKNNRMDTVVDAVIKREGGDHYLFHHQGYFC